jgi:hypothetical protein
LYEIDENLYTLNLIYSCKPIKNQVKFDEIIELYKFCKENKTFKLEKNFNKECVLFKF